MKSNINATGWGWGIGMALAAGLVGPFVLWPIERWVTFPIWLEELYKLWLVWLVLRSRPRNGFIWVITVGLGFGTSETMLYLLNFVQNGDLSNWGLRLVTTVPMHAVTMAVQWMGWVMGVGPLGIIPAGLIHQWFNSVI